MPKVVKEEYKPTTQMQVLGHFLEELGEVLQAIGKSIRFGWDSSNPELPKEKRITNLQWVKEEVRDLERAMSNFKNMFFYFPAKQPKSKK